MPRSNHPRRRAGAEEPLPIDLSRALGGTRRTEVKRDGAWNVQPMAGGQKTYTCPGCSGAIAEDVAHVVAWRADGLFGEEHDLAARRHWHSACWRIRT